MGMVEAMTFDTDDQSGTWARKRDEANRIRERAMKSMEQGSYVEAADAFMSYGSALSDYSELAGWGCTLIEAAETLESKNAFAEAGKVFLFVANALRKALLWGDAIDCYQKAGEAYAKVGQKRFNAAAAACYAGAADCFAQLKLWSEAERMMTRGSILGTGENIIELDNDARESFKKKDYGKASEGFGRIASAYVASLEQLSDLLPKTGMGEIAMETKSILLQRSSESRVAEVVCLLRNDMIQEGRKILLDAAVGFRVALMNLDPLLLVGRSSPSDYKRFSYNLMMSTLLYKLLGENDEAETMSKELIGAKERRVAEKLNTLQYYKLAGDMLKLKPHDAIKELQKVRLGGLDDMKIEVIRSFELLTER
jgi:tetratricopeptide (TPR) repeat protein